MEATRAYVQAEERAPCWVHCCLLATGCQRVHTADLNPILLHSLTKVEIEDSRGCESPAEEDLLTPTQYPAIACLTRLSRWLVGGAGVNFRMAKAPEQGSEEPQQPSPDTAGSSTRQGVKTAAGCAATGGAVTVACGAAAKPVVAAAAAKGMGGAAITTNGLSYLGGGKVRTMYPGSRVV